MQTWPLEVACPNHLVPMNSSEGGTARLFG